LFNGQYVIMEMVLRGISSSNKIMTFQRKGCCNLMCRETKKLGWKENQGIQNIGIEGCHWNRIVDQKQVLKIWENYMTELYDQAKQPENLKV